MAELTEREKFDRWCKRNHYYCAGKQVMAGPSWDRYVATSYPPRDVDLAWEAWQEALRTAGVPGTQEPKENDRD